jgi:hypothetical protein
LYQKFLILSTNVAVISDPSLSNDSARIFLRTHFFKTSFTKSIHSGTISLNNILPYVVSIIFPFTLTLISDLKSTAFAS